MGNETDLAYKTLKELLPTACQKMNDFSREVLRTRGGRIGSGMGALLEALWGYMMNQALSDKGFDYEIAWFPDNQYNDFACLIKSAVWDIEIRGGELFRIEAKSMNTCADESKAHFDVLTKELYEYDSLLILVWEWEELDSRQSYPKITDSFFNLSLPIALLRDELHIARGCSFVDANSCPDGCSPEKCEHAGEPLNAKGKRERKGGPESTRPSAKVSYAQNFGGLVRMLKTNNEHARSVFRRVRLESDTADEYISFIHQNYQSEELSHYTVDELRTVAKKLSLYSKGLSKSSLMSEIRKVPNYMKSLRAEIK